jgi:pyruvate dehydrogenase E1 component alpha subunit
LSSFSLPEEKLIGLYEKMVLIRVYEEKIGEIFAAGKLPGFVHLYIGEEAIAVGVCANLKKSDYISSTHRAHGHCIAKDCDMKKMTAELYGKATGCCKGKGGSMHLAELEVGVLGASAVVGASVPWAVGAALSARIRNTDQVAVAFFGDGAINQGVVQECFNIAAVWKLPVIFVVENNLYATSLPTRPTKIQSQYSCSIEDLSKRALGYDIPGLTVDGMDVLAVYKAAEEAVQRAREKLGPTLIECKTYRYRGHFEGDPLMYRSKEELERWLVKDPILNFKKKLMEAGVLTEKEAEDISSKAKKIVEEAVQFAEESPDPLPKDAFKDIFVEDFY